MIVVGRAIGKEDGNLKNSNFILFLATFALCYLSEIFTCNLITTRIIFLETKLQNFDQDHAVPRAQHERSMHFGYSIQIYNYYQRIPR